MITIGILKETRLPPDARVPFSPLQCKELELRFQVKICIQPSSFRVFSNEEYKKQGLQLSEDVSHCDILFGVKEVAIETLLANKVYFFFSHTSKKQSKNAKMLRTCVQKNIRLIDYEFLTNEKQTRIVAFGRFAGLVGAYNALLLYGLKYKLYIMERAYKLISIDELFKVSASINFPAFKIVVVGTGRVSKGVEDLLWNAGIKKVNTQDFLHIKDEYPSYTVLETADYYVHKDTNTYDKNDFRAHPENYISTFAPYTQVADILIATAFWDVKSPRLFTEEEAKNSNFKIKTIADITCDVNGSIPCTQRSSTILDPFFDYEPQSETLQKPFENVNNISIMAVDNLPCELHRDASIDFGRQLIDHIMPDVVKNIESEVLARATICSKGNLSKRFSYLKEYILNC